MDDNRLEAAIADMLSHIASMLRKPEAIKFIKIYGNVDLAVKENTLYADSFTDLLIFDIANSKKPKFVKRINNQFEYDPLQTIPKNARIVRQNYSGKNGVIIEWIKK